MVALLAAAVVACTSAALTLPATTWTGDGMENNLTEGTTTALAVDPNAENSEISEEIAGESAEPVSEPAESETVSDPAAQTEETAALPQGAEVPANYTQPYTFHDEENGFTVTVWAPEGAFNEEVTLKAKLLDETDSAYAEAKQELDEKAAEEPALLSEDGETPDYGFAALDIHFEDAAGEEIEPQGEVYVAIDADKLLPEDADPDSVMVQHHAEDEKTQEVTVETVADTADETDGKIETTAASDDTANVQAAFEVQSFSTFTITWDEQWRNGITVHCVDEDGHEIGNGLPGIDRSQTITMSEIAPKISGYTYERAVIAYSVNSVNWLDRGTEFVQLRYDQNESYPYRGRWKYRTKNNEWENIGYNNVYLVYTEDSSSSGQLGTIETVDSDAAGIHIGLKDIDGDYYTVPGTNFIFNNGGETNQHGHGPNYWTGSDNVWKEIVDDSLFGFNSNDAGRNAYPYLTGGGTLSSVFTGMIDCNHLFTIDEEGYYVYDAGEHFASLTYANDGKDNRNFKVYNTEYLPNNSAADTPKFLPFNDLSNENTLTDDANYHFAMRVDTTFMQPNNGEVNNGQDMVFEFTGDDDVWVYIDGVLVLDLGGIHDAQSGSINFATGVVTGAPAQNGGNTNTTLYNVMLKVKGEDWVTKNMEQNESGQWIFKDYSSHTMNFYYLERGEGGSNCKIRFNLQTIPTGNFEIGKQITNTNTEAFYDAKFEMEVLIAPSDGTSEPKDEDYENYPIKYDLYQKGTNGNDDSLIRTDCTTTENSQFTIQHNQYIRVKAYYANDKWVDTKMTDYYKVRELGASDYGNDYTFSMSDTNLIDNNGASVEDDVLGQSKGMQISQNTHVDVQNSFQKTDVYNLYIKKEMAAGSSSAATFSVQVLDSNGNPYTGSYHVYENGEDVGDNNLKAENGIITLKAGQEVRIPDVLPGSTFQVTEVNLDSSSYNTPTYQMTQNGAAAQVTPTQDTGGIAVTIKHQELENGETAQPAEVTITNSLKVIPVTMTIKKVDSSDGNSPLQNAKFKLYQVSTAEGAEKPVGLPNDYTYVQVGNELITNAQGEVRIQNLNPGEYYLLETEAPDGYQLLSEAIKFTITQDGSTNTLRVDSDLNGDGAATVVENILTLKIANQPGHELPSTGSIGTTPFATIGGPLFAVCAVGLGFGLRRRRGKEAK